MKRIIFIFSFIIFPLTVVAQDYFKEFRVSDKIVSQYVSRLEAKVASNLGPISADIAYISNDCKHVIIKGFANDISLGLACTTFNFVKADVYFSFEIKYNDDNHEWYAKPIDIVYKFRTSYGDPSIISQYIRSKAICELEIIRDNSLSIEMDEYFYEDYCKAKNNLDNATPRYNELKESLKAPKIKKKDKKIMESELYRLNYDEKQNIYDTYNSFNMKSSTIVHKVYATLLIN